MDDDKYIYNKSELVSAFKALIQDRDRYKEALIKIRDWDELPRVVIVQSVEDELRADKSQMKDTAKTTLQTNMDDKE